MLNLAPAELETVDNRGAANGLDELEPERDPFESPRQSEQAAPRPG
ncbi:MAG TPA: hypothetical protein VMK31_00100 [Sphingomicrobium sp.]|nr:hypothetical protein [Sphingomicrobium sp.]